MLGSGLGLGLGFRLAGVEPAVHREHDNVESVELDLDVEEVADEAGTPVAAEMRSMTISLIAWGLCTCAPRRWHIAHRRRAGSSSFVSGWCSFAGLDRESEGVQRERQEEGRCVRSGAQDASGDRRPETGDSHKAEGGEASCSVPRVQVRRLGFA